MEIDENNDIIKNIQAVSLGIAELSQINLYGVEINTEADIDGEDFEQFGKSILHSDNPKISILHRILKDKAPHYNIGYIDNNLIRETENRLVQFSFDNISIYDALQEIATELDALLIVDTSTIQNDVERLGNISRTINLYDLESTCQVCHHRGEFKDVCPECGASIDSISEGYGEDTAIFISSDNLSDDISLTTNNGAVKNCFKLEAGDELMTDTIRNCNPNGSNYIWYISNALKREMSPELIAALEQYDSLYQEYQTTYRYILDTNDYNALVERYIDSNKDLAYISDSVYGYPALMTSYYHVLDLFQYLSHSLMPNIEIEETTAASEAAKVQVELTEHGVAIRNYSAHTSNATIESTIKTVVSSIVSPNYKVDVATISLVYDSQSNTGGWEGNITLSRHYEDDNDPDVTITVYTRLNGSSESYCKQLIEKKISQSSSGNLYGAKALFKFDTTANIEQQQITFCNELTKYNLQSLTEFHTICDAILNILAEQGVANPDNWNEVTDTENLYKKLYLPYYARYGYIEDEIKRREDELNVLQVLNDKINDVHLDTIDALDFEKFLQTNGEDLWIEFCSFRREDTYSNSNYISDGLDNAELFAQALSFIETAKKEIYKSAILQHSIRASLNNLLALKEFSGLIEHFEVGNWLRLKADEEIYKLRLIEYEIDYEDFNKISVTFSDVISSIDGYSDVENILSSAKSISSTYQSVKRQAGAGDQSQSRINHWVRDGLDVTNIKLKLDSVDQTQEWNENGMIFRRFIPETEQFDNRQLKIINRGMYLTDDNWRSVKVGVGGFSYWNPATKQMEDSYGVIADTLVGNVILSENVGIYNRNDSITMDDRGMIITSNIDDSNFNLFTIRRKKAGSSIQAASHLDRLKEMDILDVDINFQSNSVDEIEGYLSILYTVQLEGVDAFIRNDDSVSINDELMLSDGFDDLQYIYLYLIDKYNQLTNNTSDMENYENLLYINEDGVLVLNGTMKINTDGETVSFDKFLETDAMRESLNGIIQEQVDIKANSIEQLYADQMSNLQDTLNRYESSFGQYLVYDNEGLKLGSKVSNFYTLINDDGMYFYDKSDPDRSAAIVAYINNRQLYIPDAVIKNSLTIGKFFFAPRLSGGVSLIWGDNGMEG